MSDGFASADNANRAANMIQFGTIAEVDLTARPATARIEIEDNHVTDFLPVFQLCAGRVRSWSAPMQGEQVVVLSPTGEMAAGVVLRGLNYDAFEAPSAEELLTVLAQWQDGAEDTYDEATKTRTVKVPDGGQMHVIVGAMRVSVDASGVSIDAAGSPVVVKGDPITLDGPVNLGGSGGQAVARIGDSVVSGKITTGSSSVRAA